MRTSRSSAADFRSGRRRSCSSSSSRRRRISPPVCSRPTATSSTPCGSRPVVNAVVEEVAPRARSPRTEHGRSRPMSDEKDGPARTGRHGRRTAVVAGTATAVSGAVASKSRPAPSSRPRRSSTRRSSSRPRCSRPPPMRWRSSRLPRPRQPRCPQRRRRGRVGRHRPAPAARRPQGPGHPERPGVRRREGEAAQLVGHLRRERPAAHRGTRGRPFSPTYCRAMAMRMRSSGSMKWSWSSSPRSICTQLIFPVNRLDCGV